MNRSELIIKACKYADLKPGFDRQAELYYNRHKIDVYDAFIDGHDSHVLDKEAPESDPSDHAFKNNGPKT